MAIGAIFVGAETAQWPRLAGGDAIGSETDFCPWVFGPLLDASLQGCSGGELAIGTAGVVAFGPLMEHDRLTFSQNFLEHVYDVQFGDDYVIHVRAGCSVFGA